MSSRQCSSYKLMTLQIWPFFSSYHAQFLKTHYSYLIELFTDMPQAMLNKQVTMARNYFKVSVLVKSFDPLPTALSSEVRKKAQPLPSV